MKFGNGQFACGTALLIKRRGGDDIGYLDENYFAYVEDFE
jgi:GT2 family glycosyltransferase